MPSRKRSSKLKQRRRKHPSPPPPPSPPPTATPSLFHRILFFFAQWFNNHNQNELLLWSSSLVLFGLAIYLFPLQSIVNDESSEDSFDDDDDYDNNITNLDQQLHLTTPAYNPEDLIIAAAFFKKLIWRGIASVFFGSLIGNLYHFIKGKN
ncbi:unnamed protein product [Rotaria socialis]|uniref:Uncharacterized protein n=1 Tax=Rotaria socialis TaxID=392032 RepID=A0A818LNH0_9BILA|nr:unnamed protein product [Rotaria socialis]CAF4561455.1 unnamed protein product [Rotaria socialis]